MGWFENNKFYLFVKGLGDAESGVFWLGDLIIYLFVSVPFLVMDPFKVVNLFSI